MKQSAEVAIIGGGMQVSWPKMLIRHAALNCDSLSGALQW
jgi:hypothetical protein